jgi:predicted phosphoribosyltransferase
VAIPVASRQALAVLAAETDRCGFRIAPEPFSSVGQWYQDFSDVPDDTVRALLGRQFAGRETAH